MSDNENSSDNSEEALFFATREELKKRKEDKKKTNESEKPFKNKPDNNDKQQKFNPRRGKFDPNKTEGENGDRKQNGGRQFNKRDGFNNRGRRGSESSFNRDQQQSRSSTPGPNWSVLNFANHPQPLLKQTYSNNSGYNLAQPNFSLPQMISQPQQINQTDTLSLIFSAVRELRQLNMDMIMRINHLHSSLDNVENAGKAPQKFGKHLKQFDDKLANMSDAIKSLQVSVESSNDKVVTQESEIAVLKIQNEEHLKNMKDTKDNTLAILQEIRDQEGKLQLMQADMNALKQLVKDQDLRVSTCKVCLDGILNCALLPCGHLFCISCAENTRRQDGLCPICRQLITTIHSVFFP